MSVITASASGGNEFGQREIQSLWGKGPDLRRRLPVDRLVLRGHDRADLDQARDEGTVRRRHRRGRRRRSRRSGSSRATIRRGVDLVVSGGTEAPIGPYALTCQLTERPAERRDRAGRRLPPVRRARERLRAWRGRRDHHRRERSTRRRNAHAPQIYGEIIGYGATNDAHDAKRAPRRRAARPGDVRSRSSGPGVGPDEIDASSPTPPACRSRTPPRQRRSRRSSALAPRRFR